MQSLTFPQAVARVNELCTAGRWPEVESLARACLASLPAGSSRALDAMERQLNEKLVEAQFQQGRRDEALAGFRALAERSAPAIAGGFIELYVAAMEATHAMPVPMRRLHRCYRLHQLVVATLALEGDTAECGCFRGLSSYLICGTERQHRAGYDGRAHHVLDSFEGLSAPQPEDAPDGDDPDAARLDAMCRAGAFRASLAEVQQNLAGFPGIGYRPGWIPASLAGMAERRYRIVHLDLDLHAPTAGALDYFWPRLARGGYVVCDDYGWAGARRAIDEFAARNGVAVTANEFGQAWLAKSAP